jgi:hypothetical protein
MAIMAAPRTPPRTRPAARETTGRATAPRGRAAPGPRHRARPPAPPREALPREPQLREPQLRDRYCVENAASKAAEGGSNASRATNSRASFAPTSRSIPASSHSTEMGPR